MVRQCRQSLLIALAALFAPAFTYTVQRHLRAEAGPANGPALMNMLLHTEALSSANDEFTKGSLSVTKAYVAQNDGKNKGVAQQLYLACSGLKLPLDVEICEQYRSTLLEQLSRNADFNIMKMDYGKFCTDMDRIVAEHK